MGQLSRTLEPLGLALAVVPELDQLTVGGLVMGTGVETSSHVHGLFQNICLQYELVLADGSLLTCSKVSFSSFLYISYKYTYFMLSLVRIIDITLTTPSNLHSSVRKQYLFSSIAFLSHFNVLKNHSDSINPGNSSKS